MRIGLERLSFIGFYIIVKYGLSLGEALIQEKLRLRFIDIYRFVSYRGLPLV